MKSVLRILTAASLCALTAGAHAAQITINFDGLKGPWAGTREEPANFYNGGSGSLGSGPGPDYGITFSPFGATSTNARGICNVSTCDGPTGNSLFIFGDRMNGTERGTIMHIKGGFRGIVEFDASISNLGGWANILAVTEVGGHTITGVDVRHPDPTNTCGRLQCEFFHYSFNLADDIFTPDDVVAHAILFLTQGIDAVFIDNIKFHDLILPDTPVAVSEPSTALLIGGVGLIGAMLRRRRTVDS
jgi:hypothetical protein